MARRGFCRSSQTGLDRAITLPLASSTWVRTKLSWLVSIDEAIDPPPASPAAWEEITWVFAVRSAGPRGGVGGEAGHFSHSHVRPVTMSLTALGEMPNSAARSASVTSPGQYRSLMSRAWASVSLRPVAGRAGTRRRSRRRPSRAGQRRMPPRSTLGLRTGGAETLRQRIERPRRVQQLSCRWCLPSARRRLPQAAPGVALAVARPADWSAPHRGGQGSVSMRQLRPSPAR
jgi:hypothetical protein